jgi:redox-sensitive bicupin YhaK (pirin superfamily)
MTRLLPFTFQPRTSQSLRATGPRRGWYLVKAAAFRGVAPDNPLTLLDIDIKAGGQFTHTGDKDHHAWILAIKGASRVTWNAGSADLQPGKAIAFADATDISFSSEEGAHVVLFRGQPLRQAFVQRGPYAMGTAAELDESRPPIVPVASDPLTEINTN